MKWTYKPMKLSAVAAIVLCGPALMGQSILNPPLEDLSERQVSGINLNQVTIANAASRALAVARVPGGLATESACGPEETFNLSPAGLRVRDILDSIVRTDHGYHWTIDDQVVNLSSSKNKQSLLDVLIPEFKLEGEATQDSIVERLLNATELQKAMVQQELKRGFTNIGLRSLDRPGSPPTAKKAFDIHLRDASLRTVLNAAARAHGTAVWRYHEKLCEGKREFTLSFLVW